MGDIGSLPGQAAWDSDYDNVYHHQPKQRGEISTTIGGSTPDHLGFPMACKAANGDIVLAYRHGITHSGDDASTEIIISKDEGASWSSPYTALNNTNMDDAVTLMVTCPNGDLLIWIREYWMGTWSTVKWARSTNNGSSFGSFSDFPSIGIEDPQYPHDVKIVGSNMYMALRVIDSGERKEYFLKSTNNGTTWTKQGEIVSSNADETALLHLGSGNWIAVMRDYPGQGTTWKFTSSDDGEYWTNWNK